jgi:hypothetical protein
VRGLDNRIYENYSNDLSHWSGWSEVPGEGLTISEPAATIYNNQLLLFVRGYDNRVYLNKFDGAGWSAVTDAVPGAGLTIAGPTALVDGNNGLRLFITAVDDGVWENDLAGNNWSGWFHVTDGALTPSGPMAVEGQYSPGVYLQAEDGQIFFCYF